MRRRYFWGELFSTFIHKVDSIQQKDPQGTYGLTLNQILAYLYQLKIEKKV